MTGLTEPLGRFFVLNLIFGMNLVIVSRNSFPTLPCFRSSCTTALAHGDV